MSGTRTDMRFDEEPNQRFPQRLSYSCNPNAFDALDEPIQTKVDEEPSQVWSKEKPNQKVVMRRCIGSISFNSNTVYALEWRNPVVRNVMEALADPNAHLIGVYGSNDNIKDALLQIVNRRIQRDNLFDLVLTAKVTRKPNIKKIQDELARQLGLTLTQKSKDKRVNELIHRMEHEHKILIVLRDLYKSLDLGKVGILYGANHTGCKILLTSTTIDVLSNHMHTQEFHGLKFLFLDRNFSLLLRVSSLCVL